MPFFINLTSLIAFAAAFSCVASLIVPIIGESVNLAKDNAQYQACKAADPKTTFGGIRYGEGPTETVVYNECIPWRNEDGIIANAVFCRPATCFVFADKNCTRGPSVLIPVIVPSPIDFLNAADAVELLGQSGFCSPNALSTLF